MEMFIKMILESLFFNYKAGVSENNMISENKCVWKNYHIQIIQSRSEFGTYIKNKRIEKKPTVNTETLDSIRDIFKRINI